MRCALYYTVIDGTMVAMFLCRYVIRQQYRTRRLPDALRTLDTCTLVIAGSVNNSILHHVKRQIYEALSILRHLVYQGKGDHLP